MRSVGVAAPCRSRVRSFIAKSSGSISALRPIAQVLFESSAARPRGERGLRPPDGGDRGESYASYRSVEVVALVCRGEVCSLGELLSGVGFLASA